MDKPYTVNQSITKLDMDKGIVRTFYIRLNINTLLSIDTNQCFFQLNQASDVREDAV